MQESQNTSKFYDNLWAALIFFTRLPFWRVYQPPKSSYAAVVEWWPLTGWLIGGAMAATLYYGAMVMPYAVAIIAAIVRYRHSSTHHRSPPRRRTRRFLRRLWRWGLRPSENPRHHEGFTYRHLWRIKSHPLHCSLSVRTHLDVTQDSCANHPCCQSI